MSHDEFITTISPCLQLVAPVGMIADAQDAWFEAAWIALDGIPLGLLIRGCRAAMRSADHPSKIVPAIIREIEADWKWRRRIAADPRPAPASLPAPPDPAAERERADVGQLLRGLVAKMERACGED